MIDHPDVGMFCRKRKGTTMACMRINVRRCFGVVDGDVERVRFTFMDEERGRDGKRLGREGKCLGLLKPEVAAGIRRATL